MKGEDRKKIFDIVDICHDVCGSGNSLLLGKQHGGCVEVCVGVCMGVKLWFPRGRFVREL